MYALLTFAPLELPTALYVVSGGIGLGRPMRKISRLGVEIFHGFSTFREKPSPEEKRTRVFKENPTIPPNLTHYLSVVRCVVGKSVFMSVRTVA